MLLAPLCGGGSEERGKYRLACFGREAGFEEYRLEHFEDGHLVLFSRADYGVEIGGKLQSFASDTVLTMDKTFAPIRYAGYHKAGGEVRQPKIEWKGGTACPDRKPPVKSAAVHLVDNNVVAHYLPILRRHEGGVRKLKVFQAAAGADVEALVRDKGEVLLRGEGREERVREVEITVGGLAATAYVDAARRPVRLEFPALGMLAELEGYERLTVHPASPLPETLEESEATIRVGALVLRGTVTRPRGPTGGPGVLLVSGAAPEDRDGNRAGTADPGWVPGGPAGGDFLKQIARSLAASGMTVLRVDDRGCGTSEGNYAGSRFSDFVADAEAGVAQLREAGAVSVSIVGHGEGGLVAAAVAAKDAGITAVILLGTPLRPLEAILLEDAARMLREQGAKEDVARGILSKQKELLGRVRKAKGDTLVIDERKTPVGWLRERLNLDAAATVRKVGGTACYLQGSKDARSGPADLEHFRQARPGAPDRRFEGLDQAFRREGNLVDAEFLGALAGLLPSPPRRAP